MHLRLTRKIENSNNASVHITRDFVEKISVVMVTVTAMEDEGLTLVNQSPSNESLTPKRETRKRQLTYEVMLMNDLSGSSKKANQAMHAVLEGDLEETEEKYWDVKGVKTPTKVRNHALIHYIAQLANSNNDNDTFDFSFVESLIKNGADINARDKHGQTVFHEVARSWHLDVASFLLKHGARVDQQDKYGRAPLHVAAAVDYAKMVEFLVNNGADVNIKTQGEEQSPIHFAAKNDACLSLKVLLAYGANMGARDYQERTPLQVAAGLNRSKTARLLIEMGAPAGVYDVNGEVALSLLILKMPDVALIALDQFQSDDMINQKRYYFLNYLEGPRLQEDKRTGARVPLEVVVQTKQFDILMHPVMQRLVCMKWQKFGKRGAFMDLAANLFFAILWTVLGVTLPHRAVELYKPLSERWWRLVLAILVMFLTVVQIFKQVASFYRDKTSLTKWKGYREKALERDLPYCHPRWPEEKRYLDSEIKEVRDERLLSSQDGWFYIDWFALILILASGVSHAAFFLLDTIEVYYIHTRLVCLLLIVIWFRIMKYARPFNGPGPLVAIFSFMLGDILKWLVLFLAFFIPYSACFWMIFGGYSINPTAGFNTLSQLLYTVFGMTVLSDYNFEGIDKVDPVMARVLCASYIFICSIIILNLLIGLLANTFTRVYENAISNAGMQRAKTILNLEQSLEKKKKKKYYEFVRKNCSPEKKEVETNEGEQDRDQRKKTEEMRTHVSGVHSLINEQFGKRFGTAQKSDFDETVHNILLVLQEIPKVRTLLQLAIIRMKILDDVISKNSTMMLTNKCKRHQRRQSSASVKSSSSRVEESRSKSKTDPSIGMKKEKYVHASAGKNLNLAPLLSKRSWPHTHGSKDSKVKTRRDISKLSFRKLSSGRDERKAVSSQGRAHRQEYLSLSDNETCASEQSQTQKFDITKPYLEPAWSYSESNID